MPFARTSWILPSVARISDMDWGWKLIKEFIERKVKQMKVGPVNNGADRDRTTSAD